MRRPGEGQDPGLPWVPAFAGMTRQVASGVITSDDRGMATNRLDAILKETRQEFRLIRAEIAEINKLLDKLPTKRRCLVICLAVPAALFPVFYLFQRFVPLQ
jgi:hypothetical protein